MSIFVNFENFMSIVCLGMFCTCKRTFALLLLTALKLVIKNCARPLPVLPKVSIIFRASLLLTIYIQHFDCFVRVDLLIIHAVGIFCFSSFGSSIVKFDVDISCHFCISQLMYHATLKIQVTKKHLGLIRMLKLMG